MNKFLIVLLIINNFLIASENNKKLLCQTLALINHVEFNIKINISCQFDRAEIFHLKTDSNEIIHENVLENCIKPILICYKLLPGESLIITFYDKEYTYKRFINSIKLTEFNNKSIEKVGIEINPYLGTFDEFKDRIISKLDEYFTSMTSNLEQNKIRLPKNVDILKELIFDYANEEKVLLSEYANKKNDITYHIFYDENVIRFVDLSSESSWHLKVC